MKRFVIVAGITAVLLLFFLLLPRPSDDGGPQPPPEAGPETPAATNAPPRPNEPVMGNEHGPTSADTDLASLLKGDQQEMAVRSFNETANVPVEFPGQVVDQDTNPLPNVQVGVVVGEGYMTLSLL